MEAHKSGMPCFFVLISTIKYDIMIQCYCNGYVNDLVNKRL